MSLAGWEAFGRMQVFGYSFPAFSSVVETLLDPTKNGLFTRALETTLSEAAVGFLLGSALAIAISLVAAALPILQDGLARFAALAASAPVVALGPLLIIFFPREASPVVNSTLAVFFAAFVASSAGLLSAPAAQGDVLASLGAGRFQRLVRLQIPFAVPDMVAGLRFGGPAAMLGAIIGEWFGSERGLGVLLLTSMQNIDIDLMWAAAVLSAGVSLIVFGLMSVLQQASYERFR